jgi:predicted RNA-binding protein (virulence factor B family)
MKIGQINSLIVSRETPHGFYLKDDEEKEVLLPGKYLKGDEKEGDKIEVFIYNDSEDRLVATTETPKISLDEFAVLKVVDVSKYGVFLDWGLEKDLLVPFKEQNKKMVSGKSYVVKMYLDEDTDRLVATAKVKKFLSNETLELAEKDEVDLLVFNESDLGYDVIINEKYQGLIFRNEVFTAVKIGDQLKGYVKKIREDNKIDVSLQKDGVAHMEKSAQEVLDALNTQGGTLNISDKSSPEEIYELLHMSKKAFKKAIGTLYKQRKIVIKPNKISLAN